MLSRNLLILNLNRKFTKYSDSLYST